MVRKVVWCGEEGAVVCSHLRANHAQQIGAVEYRDMPLAAHLHSSTHATTQWRSSSGQRVAGECGECGECTDTH